MAQSKGSGGRGLALVLAATLLGVGWTHAQSAGPQPQNLLVIVLDDVGTDLIGAYESIERAQGRPAGWPAETPAIDQLLVAQGVTFTSAWATPKCSPTRAQILTGMHGLHSGIGSIVRSSPFVGARNPGLDHDAAILPQQLQTALAPYASGAVGKWHLGDIDQMQDNAGHALGEPSGAWFQHFAGSRFNLESALGPGGGNAYWSWRKIYATAIGLSTPCGPNSAPCEVDVIAPPTQNYATADTTEDALALMAALPEPWLIYVSYNAVHAPYHVPPTDLPGAPCLNPAGMPVACEVPVLEHIPSLARCMMTTLDQQIGRLVCAAAADRTTIALIGDNGSPQPAIAAPFAPLHGKGTMYEGGVRVPLVIRSPLIPPARRGTVEPRLVSAVDLHATLLEIAGAPPLFGADGVSLTGYLGAASAPSVRWFNYSEAFFPNFVPAPAGGPSANYVGNYHNQAIRNARFKLIRRTTREHSNPAILVVSEEFFDLTQGGPPDTSVYPPAPTPDWFEAHDLLASGAPLQGAARDAYGKLTTILNTRYPSVVR